MLIFVSLPKWRVCEIFLPEFRNRSILWNSKQIKENRFKSLNPSQFSSSWSFITNRNKIPNKKWIATDKTSVIYRNLLCAPLKYYSWWICADETMFRTYTVIHPTLPNTHPNVSLSETCTVADKGQYTIFFTQKFGERLISGYPGIFHPLLPTFPPLVLPTFCWLHYNYRGTRLFPALLPPLL